MTEYRVVISANNSDIAKEIKRDIGKHGWYALIQKWVPPRTEGEWVAID